MTLDDRLDEQFKRMDGTTVLPIYNRPTAIGQAKEAILSDLLEIIGEDEQVMLTATTSDGEEIQYGEKRIKVQNQLRAELREKVKEYCK